MKRSKLEKNGSSSMKRKILEGAARVFADKGFARATIALIVQEAKVSETSLYEHFEGKEDLFLAIPSAQIAEKMPMVDESLFGIKSALAQLRKFIWVYVRNLAEEPVFTRVVLLHVKTSNSFLNTSAYREVQKFYGRLLDIIIMGQKSGEINPDLDPYAARGVIIGSLEYLVTRWLLKNCSYDIFGHLERIYDVIEAGLVNRGETPEHATAGTALSEEQTRSPHAGARKNKERGVRTRVTGEDKKPGGHVR